MILVLFVICWLFLVGGIHKTSLFTNHMNFYIENPKESTKLKLMVEFSYFSRCISCWFTSGQLIVLFCNNQQCIYIPATNNYKVKKIHLEQTKCPSTEEKINKLWYSHRIWSMCRIAMNIHIQIFL